MAWVRIPPLPTIFLLLLQTLHFITYLPKILQPFTPFHYRNPSHSPPCVRCWQYITDVQRFSGDTAPVHDYVDDSAWYLIHPGQFTECHQLHDLCPLSIAAGCTSIECRGFECRGFESQLIFLRKSDCLGCAVLVRLVCLLDLACFFLSSFASLIKTCKFNIHNIVLMIKDDILRLRSVQNFVDS